MKITTFFWITFFLSFHIPSIAQFSLNGEIRPRSEFRYGYVQLPSQNQTPAIFISQRSRLSAKYQTDKLQFKLTTQDARIWGGENNLSFYEAWVKYRIAKHISLTIGRQALQYGKARLIGARNRRQQGFNYDAIVANYTKDSLSVDLGYSLNNSQANLFGNAFTNATTQFKNFSFLYLKKYFDNGFTISTTGINSGFQKENSDTIYYKQTIGTTLDYTKNNFLFGIEGYYQMGKHKDGRATNAYLIVGNIGYQFSPKIKLTIGTEFTSGHDVTNTNTDYQSTLHNFDILEGARFIYWGNMNQFVNLETHTASGGLTEYHAKLDFQVSKKITTKLHYHQFYLSQSVLNNNVAINPNLGSELDISAKYIVKKHTTIALGYSIMIPTNSLRFIQDIPSNSNQNGHYLWLMITTKLKLI